MNRILVFLFILVIAACGKEYINVPGPTVTITMRPTSEPTHILPSPPVVSPSPIPTVAPFIGPSVFQPFVTTFVAQGRAFNRMLDTSELQIGFGDLTPYGATVIGLCQTFSNAGAKITVKQTWFESVSDTQKQLLLSHEMGHCVLFRPHRTDLNADGTPTSIMYPIILGSSVFRANASGYLSELYTFGWNGEQLQASRRQNVMHFCPTRMPASSGKKLP